MTCALTLTTVFPAADARRSALLGSDACVWIRVRMACESPPSTSAWMDWAVALSMRMVYGLMFSASARSERKFEMKRFFFLSLAMSDWSAAIEKVASLRRAERG